MGSQGGGQKAKMDLTWTITIHETSAAACLWNPRRRPIILLLLYKKLIGKGKTTYQDLLYMIAVFALDNASLGSANYKAK